MVSHTQPSARWHDIIQWTKIGVIIVRVV